MASLRTNARKPYARPAQRGNADGQWLHDKFQNGNNHQRRDNGLNGGVVAAPSAPAGISNRLKVSNLHYEVTPSDLNTIFGQIGTLVREPLLWYDQSGRSTGRATVTFETAAEATRAKNQFDGILAKGQPMQVEYYVQQPRQPRRTASEPTALSLLNRIEKPPLLDRLASDDTATTETAKKGRAGGPQKGKIGPIRGKAPRPGKPKHAKKQPKSAEDLDKELDAFMGDVAPAAQAPASTSQAPTTQDVDMA